MADPSDRISQLKIDRSAPVAAERIFIVTLSVERYEPVVPRESPR